MFALCRDSGWVFPHFGVQATLHWSVRSETLLFHFGVGVSLLQKDRNSEMLWRKETQWFMHGNKSILLCCALLAEQPCTTPGTFQKHCNSIESLKARQLWLVIHIKTDNLGCGSQLWLTTNSRLSRKLFLILTELRQKVTQKKEQSSEIIRLNSLRLNLQKPNFSKLNCSKYIVNELKV